MGFKDDMAKELGGLGSRRRTVAMSLYEYCECETMIGNMQISRAGHFLVGWWWK